MAARNSRPSSFNNTEKKFVEIKMGCCGKNPIRMQRHRLYDIQISVLSCLQISAFIVTIIYLANHMFNKQAINAKADQQMQQLMQFSKFVNVLQNETFFTMPCNDNTLPELSVNFSWLNETLINRLRIVRKKLNKVTMCSDWSVVEDYNDLISDILHVGFGRVENIAVNIWRELFSYMSITKAIESFNIAVFYANLQFCCNGTTAPILLQKIATHKKLSTEFFNLPASVLSWIKSISPPEDTAINDNLNFHMPFPDVSDHNRAGETFKNIQEQIQHKIATRMANDFWKICGDSTIAMICLTVLMMSSFAILFVNKRSRQTVEMMTANFQLIATKLKSERDTSDCLLDLMLPEPVSHQLKLKKEVIAESFDCVTILFADIVGFTTLSSQSTPMQVIKLLNDLYNGFDACVELHDAYKVETIGDAYMVASGLPIRNGHAHLTEIADVALELVRKSKHFEIPHKAGEKLEIRTGVHTGPCVAGVVGSKMPRYCLFGDTINTASRMESTGKAGRIHMSQTTKDALEEFDDSYEIVPRNLIEVKGKGSMNTFWLVRKRKFEPEHLSMKHS
ncbi:hypothetical protein CHUAL_001736 [Chamberlinius hualienensis]